MKTYGLGLLGLLLAVTAGVAHSQTAWLLVERSSRSLAVVRAEREATRDLVAFADFAPNFGESRKVVAVVAAEWLHVIDKESATVTSFQLATQPQYIGYPISDLSGALRNMLVTDDHAFFPTVRLAGQVPPNELGGQYDIVQVSLTDGSLRSIPLPEDCVGPRLAEIGGVPVVYAWGGDRAWTLDVANGRVMRILESGDLADLRAKEAAAPRTAGGAPRAFIRYAMVPEAGAFRLSTLGELTRILDEHLARVEAPASPVWLGPAHDVLAVRVGTANGSPAIGVVRQQSVVRLQGGRTFSFLDASTLETVWATDVTQDAIPESFYAAANGSVFYIDGATGAVIRLSQNEGPSTSWHLHSRQSDSARILSIDLE